jgi:hypothetical protein
MADNQNTPKTIVGEGAGESLFSSESNSVTNNDNTSKTIVAVNDGLDSFTKEGIETIEVTEPVFIRTETKIESGREVTYSIYSDRVTVRKIDGVIVSTTNK